MDVHVGEIWKADYADQLYFVILKSDSKGYVIKSYWDWRDYNDRVMTYSIKEIPKTLEYCNKVNVENCPKRIRDDYRKHFHAV